MRIQNSTHTFRPRPEASAPETSSPMVEDTFQKSESWNPVPRFNPIFRSVPARTTEEKIARIQVMLDREWKFFGRQSYGTDGRLIRKGFSEEHPRVYKRVGHYWKEGTGLGFLDGRDRDWPWSAAFISTMHEAAGVGPQFRRSPAHARYIRDAIFSKRGGVKEAAYWGHRVTERAPQVGDMVCYSRQKGVSYDHQPLRYKSHADIVTAVRPGEIDVIGGNVGNSVSKKSLKTDENGLLVDDNYNWFAILEPRDLSAFSTTPPEHGTVGAGGTV